MIKIYYPHPQAAYIGYKEKTFLTENSTLQYLDRISPEMGSRLQFPLIDCS